MMTIGNDDAEEKECPYCGRMVVSYAMFCTYCGERFDRIKCPKCGREADLDANFCSICGTKLDSGAIAQLKSAVHQYVDLGLPSGTLWADRNIGASSPEDAGDYFAWGETKPKDEYTEDTYTYHDNPTTLPSSHDAATQNWGSDWSMPSKDQFEELKDNCETPIWKTLNGKRGVEFTSKINRKTIFFPAAGYKEETLELWEEGGVLEGGVLWSSAFYESDGAGAFLFVSDDVGMTSGDRFYGVPVRAVRCKNKAYSLKNVGLLLDYLKQILQCDIKTY